jgi:hypothetical protein
VYNEAIVESKLANQSRQALLEAAKRMTPEERLRAFIRHNKLVTQLAEAGKRARVKARGGG